MKNCTKCKESKPLSEFNKAGNSKDGRSRTCRECNKAQCNAYNNSQVGQAKALKRNIEKYGISQEEFEHLTVKQNGVCAICFKPENHWPRLCVDHNHKTGKVRGLLCNNCNRAIGMLKDDTFVLLSAVRYLNAKS